MQGSVGTRRTATGAPAEAGLAVPLPARGGPSLLASRPAPAGELADPGQAG